MLGEHGWLPYLPPWIARLGPRRRHTGPKPLFLLPSCGRLEDLLLPDTAAGGSGPAAAAAARSGGGANGGGGGDRGSTAAAAAAAAHEVVVLVPTEAAKQAVRRQLGCGDGGAGQQVLVLTALESKGLEFKVRAGGVVHSSCGRMRSSLPACLRVTPRRTALTCSSTGGRGLTWVA